MAEESGPKMLDYTDSLMGQQDPDMFPEIGDTESISDPFANATTVTSDMIRKRPDIKKVLLEPLKDMIIPWPEDEEEPEPDDYIDKQLANAVNLDPHIQTSIFEAINGLGDVIDDEGDEMYFPSIFNMDVVEDIIKQAERGGFREDYDMVPAKYTHLSEKHQNMIYCNPEARKVLAKMSADDITEQFVEQMCS